MKLGLRRVLGILLGAHLFFSGPGVCSTIDWKSYTQGVAEAKSQGKKVFLYFTTDWCAYCEKMDQESLGHGGVISFLNQNFISIRVDGDHEKKIVRAYKVFGYPESFFLDENMNPLLDLPGFVGPGLFYFYMEYIVSNAYRTMSPRQYYDSR
ncbi:MAG: thioredoxin family protein [Proteobacteria bacterium]|nr:thioredoxin family protein [Pseudomonadota bacterium]